MGKILIIGLGLIGGSVAKSLNCPVYALDTDPHTLKEAEQYLEAGYTDIEQIDIQPEAVILCAPVSAVLSMAEALGERFPDSIFIDCCSTKRSVQKAFSGMKYAGMHPMAGSESSGFGSARAGLFRGAAICITGQGEAADYACALAEKLGGRIIRIDAGRHDAATAMISHMPHIVACALCAAAAEKGRVMPEVYSLAAGGFADLTRIADSDPSMWGSILYDNSDEVLGSMEALQKQLDIWKDLLKNGSESSLREHFKACREDKQNFKRDERGIYPKNGVSLYIDCAEEQLPHIAETAFGLGAAAVIKEGGRARIICLQRREAELIKSALGREKT